MSPHLRLLSFGKRFRIIPSVPEVLARTDAAVTLPPPHASESVALEESIRARHVNRAIYAAASIVGLIGVSVLAGWAFHIETLKSVLPGFIAMQPWTAVSFILGACALTAITRRQRERETFFVASRSEMQAATEAERRRLFAMMDLAALMVRDFNGIIHYWSDGCQRLYGWTADEAVGRSSHDLLQTVFPAPLEQINTSLHEHGEWSGELRHRTRSGDEVIVRARKVLRPADAGQPEMVTESVTDVTPLVRAERALRDAAARLRLVQQVGGIGSSESTTSDGAAAVSEQLLQLYGLAAGQNGLKTADWLELIHPEDRMQVEEGVAGLAAQASTVAMQFRIRGHDGAVRWIAMRGELFDMPDGQNLRLITAHQDVTEMVAAREALAVRGDELESQVAQRTTALADAEARFRAIFDSQIQYITVVAPDGTVLDKNRALLEAVGTTAQQVIGKPIWEGEGWTAADCEWLRTQIRAAAWGGSARRELARTSVDGRRLVIDFSLKPVRDGESGAVKWIIAEGRDITEQRDLANQLSQAQKVQALGQLAGGIAHDFNNILQTTSGAATLISRRPGDPVQVKRLAKIAVDAAARGASITQRLLSFARRGEMQVEPLVTAELLEGVREVLAHTLGVAVTVRAVVPEGLPPLLSDRGQLETALVNLGTNARDAMRDGGTLTFSAAADRMFGQAAHSAGLAPGGYIRIEVADTGCGMDDDTLARVFEPFFTTKERGHGTGLGLSMVKGFVEQSGGKLSIRSQPGVGTTITLWLPQAEQAAAAAIGAEPGERGGKGSTARVLLVDDDDLVRETIAAQLEDVGFDVVVASGGAEAIALVEAGEAPDALVTDLSMPGMSGVETIQRARKLRPGMPCFLLTGYAGERAALEAGDAFTLVRKPISGAALADRIEVALEAARGA